MVLNQPSYQAKPSFQYLDSHYVKDDFSDSISCDALKGEEDQDWSLYIGVAAEENKVLIFDLDTPYGGCPSILHLGIEGNTDNISSTPEEFTKRKGITPS
jgi:hypothetical protein